MLDSGAYSANTWGRNIAVVDYMAYIRANQEYIKHYITLDVIGNPRITRAYYEIMRQEGFNPIPVYHYGDDLEYLRYYVDSGVKYLALGNTVPISDKQKVASWVKSLQEAYPGITYHILGSTCPQIADIEGVTYDAASWILRAKNGHPRHITGTDTVAKIERGVWQMRHALERGFTL